MDDGVAATAQPLRGRRVLVTRARHQASHLSARLRAAGAEAVEVPLIEIEAAAGRSQIRSAVERLRDHQAGRWAVFTSANAVRVVAGALEGPHRLGGSTVVAVGERTAALLIAWGCRPDLIPAVHSGQGVAAAMTAFGVAGAGVWLPRGDLADDALPEALRAAGAAVEVQIVYRTVMPPGASGQLASAGRLDAITLTSDSTARNLARALAGRQVGGDTVVACLGPVTAAAARGAGLRVDAVASGTGTGALVAALANAFAAREPLP